MLTDSQMQTLRSIYDSPSKAIEIIGDKAYIVGTDEPLPSGPHFVSRLVSLTIAQEITATLFRLTPRAGLVLDNPEYLNQLTLALYNM